MKVFVRTALGAFFTALVASAFAISFAAIIYTGDLAQFMRQGIGLTLLGAVLISVMGAFSLSYKGSILGPQDVPAILIATSASSTIVAAQLGPDAVFATLACLIAVCSVSSGVTSFLVGHLRLAFIARFFPYPVLAGFLATTGLLLLLAGIDIALAGMQTPDLAAYFSSDGLLRWGLVTLIAILMVVGTRKFSGFLVMPFALIAALFGFFALYALLGYSMADLRDERLLLGPFEDGGFLGSIDPSLPFKADWGVILSQAPLILSVSAATLIGTTLNASGLEMQLNRDFDLNREIKGTGLANVVSGMVGGIPGYHVVGETILAKRLGLVGAIAGLSSAAGCVFLLFMGGSLLTALPVGFFAAVIAFLGVDLLYTWFWEERRQFGWSDYGVVILIPLVAVIFGFLTAIAVGLLLACALFVLAYARLNIIRSQSDVSTRRSRMERPDAEGDILSDHGHVAKIIELTGFLFFGSAHGLRTKLRDIVTASPELQWVVLDFRFVSGIDVSTRYILKRIATDCADKEIKLVLTGLGKDAAQDLSTAQGVCEVMASLEDGIEYIEGSVIDEVQAVETNGSAIFDRVERLFSENRLVDYADDMTLEVDETVVSQAANSKDIYLVKSGRLQVSSVAADGQEVIIAHVRPGSVVGEMANYSSGARTAKIIATAPTSLIRIKMDDFDTLEAERPEIAASFHRLMAQVLARRLARTTKLLRDLGV